MCNNGPKECESATFYLRKKYLCSETVCNPKALPCVPFDFSKN